MVTTNHNIKSYEYCNSDPTWSNKYLWPVVKAIIDENVFREKRCFDLGCGNGATSNYLSNLGFEMVGVDPSCSGIEQANKSFPSLKLYQGSSDDNLYSRYGQFPIVISLEVIEHCYSPRTYMSTFYDLLEEGGIGIISTPYHGYLKNLALAITGKLENHFTALWDGGHIKFFSIKSLTQLMNEAGFKQIDFTRVGRIPPLAKSMVAVVRK